MTTETTTFTITSPPASDTVTILRAMMAARGRIADWTQIHGLVASWTLEEAGLRLRAGYPNGIEGFRWISWDALANSLDPAALMRQHEASLLAGLTN